MTPALAIAFRLGALGGGLVDFGGLARISNT